MLHFPIFSACLFYVHDSLPSQLLMSLLKIDTQDNLWVQTIFHNRQNPMAKSNTPSLQIDIRPSFLISGCVVRTKRYHVDRVFFRSCIRIEMKIESDFYYPFYYQRVENDFFSQPLSKTKISIEMDRLPHSFKKGYHVHGL